MKSLSRKGYKMKYKSREYCRDINCVFQRMIDEPYLVDDRPFAENYCRTSCQAYNFHQWLKKNGYLILKKEKANFYKSGEEKVLIDGSISGYDPESIKLIRNFWPDKEVIIIRIMPGQADVVLYE